MTHQREMVGRALAWTSGRSRGLTGLALSVAVATGMRGTAHGQLVRTEEVAVRAHEAIAGLDLDDARALLGRGDPNDPLVVLESALLAVYEERCDDAVGLLERPDLPSAEGVTDLRDIARGCARVIAATVVDADAAQGVVIRYQDAADRVLTPLIVETVARAREALTRDLGASWPKPTRVTVVRNLLSLSAMTALPLKSAETTGTVAVAKWGRVTLLSPRAAEHGFPWRDTLAHELTHLAVSRASADHAPLWLQEGIAKREEVRWRPQGPFDDRPSPDSVVVRGLETGLTVPLDRLGPSIAMLPTAEAAMVAFAEVTSFVRFFADSAGPEALPRLLEAVRRAPDVDAALQETSGADLHGWDARWQAGLASASHEPLPAIYGLGGVGPDWRDVRHRVRLTELLFGRGHPGAAAAELDHVTDDTVRADPALRTLRASVFGALGRRADGHAELDDPLAVASAYAPWWAIRGRWQREEGRPDEAIASFAEAVAISPFEVQTACEVDESDPEPTERVAAGMAAPSLCDAAKARHEPPLGRD